jgi:mono/diheme cytochrome c family protein
MCAVSTLYLLTQPSAGQSKPVSIHDGIFTPTQATLGDRAFGVNCASCHGTDLAGGQHAPSLAGDAFLLRWQGRSVGDLFQRISTSMPQQSPGTLTAKTVLDIVAFILQANGYPTGNSELTDPNQLNKIKIDPGPTVS